MKLIALAVLLVAVAGSAQADTCSNQNRICMRFCSDSGRGYSCTSDCEGRQMSCLQTGSYYWINRPTATNLQRR